MRALGRANRFPAAPAVKQDGAHGRGLADAVGGDITGDELHRVVDGQSGTDTAAGRIDVEVDVRLRVFRLQEEHLGHDRVGHFIVDPGAQKDDAILQQTAVDVVDAFFATAFFNNVGDQWHRSQLLRITNAARTRFAKFRFRCFWCSADTSTVLVRSCLAFSCLL